MLETGAFLITWYALGALQAKLKTAFIQKTAELCKHLIDTLQIEKTCVGHNTKVDGIENFEGICSRSNYDSTFTDLNPSFNFETFIKFLENEQFA